MTHEILPATQSHAAALAPRLRVADVAEVAASHGFTSLEALTASLAASDVAYALVLDGEVVALWGVAAIRTTLVGVPVGGLVWLLGSPALVQDRRLLVRLARAEVGAMVEAYGTLVNYVDARYGAALAFARWLGFEVGDPEPFGAAGLDFCRITLSSPRR